MRILVLQFASAARRRPLPRFEPHLGTLLSLMRERGHELALFGISRYDVHAIKAALARSLPQLIYADISPVCVDVARRALQYVQEHEFVPVVAGGAFATLDPSACLSLPGVRAAAVGEPDAPLATYLERIKDPAIGQVVHGLWMRDERGLSQPPLPPLVEDLDSLPFPERDLFDYAAHVRRSGEIEIAIGRGCPQRCAYCGNPAVRALHDGRGAWVRRRSAEHVLDEIAQLRERFVGVRSVRFLDHAFALDPAWLESLCSAFPSSCGLPFRCHVRANAVDAAIANRLAAAGCRRADVELISASDFVRNEVFAMDLSGEQIDAAMGALRTAGIAVRAIIYLGAPYESEASLAETVQMLRRLRPDAVDARPYFPWPGTAAANLARQNGWLHSRGEEQYHAGRCGINMPACRPAIVEAVLAAVRREFPGPDRQSWLSRWSAASAETIRGWFRREE